VIEFIPGEGADPAHVRFQVLINGQSANEAIRTDEASQAASKYAALPTVRAALLTVQRTLGAGRPRVLDGRDIGSVVFPDAAVKIFLEADEAERARRRQAELAARGETHSTVAIAQAQAERDRRDSQRKTAPLTRAPGAVALDSTVLSPGDLADEVEKLVAAVLHR
jgi:CMP/dCMP kinase